MFKFTRTCTGNEQIETRIFKTDLTHKLIAACFLYLANTYSSSTTMLMAVPDLALQ